MSSSSLLRFLRTDTGEGPRVGRVAAGQGAGSELVELLDHDDPLAALRGTGRVEACVPLAGLALLPPVHAPEIWCAGVTYERSRDARVEEAATGAADVYSLVYEADRPELFLKDAQMRRTVGPGGQVGLRSDSSWLVPEPELALLLDADGKAVAVTIGNDVSSRDIEGANPLYLPQAKVYANACAIGPMLAVPDDWDAPFTIRLRIAGPDGRLLFSGETSTASMKRRPLELVSWLLRDNPVPPGALLLTGTGLVPGGEFTLEPGQVVQIEVPGIGVLSNAVGPTRRRSTR